MQRLADSPDGSLSQATILECWGLSERMNESGRVLMSHIADGKIMSFLDIFVEFVVTQL